MKKSYDFSTPRRNPYAKLLKMPATIWLHCAGTWTKLGKRVVKLPPNPPLELTGS